MENLIKVEFTIPCNLSSLSIIERKIDKFFELINYECVAFEDIYFYINLALTEAIVNAIQHSREIDKKIKITMEFNGDEIILRVYNKGGSFSVNSIKKPPPLAESGRGLFVIKSIMDYIEVKNVNNGNFLIMKKRVNAKN
jgi:serine/threonine-protein kinase RsbW